MPGSTNTGLDVDFAAASEELSTDVLNGFIRSILPVDVGLKYESGVTSQVGVEVKQSVWDDRIEITGGFGNTSNSQGNRPTDNYSQGTRPTDNYVGEFQIEAKLNKKGNIRAKVYNEANDELENEGQYTQGAGFVWKKKFDTFKIWARKEETDTARIKRFMRKMKETENEDQYKGR